MRAIVALGLSVAEPCRGPERMTDGEIPNPTTDSNLFSRPVTANVLWSWAIRARAVIANPAQHFPIRRRMIEFVNRRSIMIVTKQDIERFHEFAVSRISDGEDELTWRQLFELWRFGQSFRRRIHSRLGRYSTIIRCDGGRPDASLFGV